MNWATPGGSYAYDGLGRRFKAVVEGDTRGSGSGLSSDTAYIYLASKQIAEQTTVVQQSGGKQYGFETITTQAQYVHTDALGSPVAHTDEAGEIKGDRTRFEPYGYVAQGTKPGVNTSLVGFTGHVQDAETDLVYMQQRYYDPIAGRFLSVDPVVTDAASGDGFNRYAYGHDNPYKYVESALSMAR